ncbi:hypothetical protein AGABI1DRAFT_133317 [Agaricus bisporus var. burnettii JB137-S8]|uniref:Uncharacterized protein n=1 Tax=Agaricus bisporus var. burnettii (strain JB137-S8 / ATCC MYA-4627 / FGSC 10392) TaxID=597362 RepID=K5WUZ4_AGABU|nr:uncharacterized protein AGABI1DRAFT_133317 [Agaricus bisporus var. burnettii JB137-S8]EKM74392.1 hypothetical protein AGABI1DRAFT_133317 [Agaricus bisporus var. burnettii JB137-S8]
MEPSLFTTSNGLKMRMLELPVPLLANKSRPSPSMKLLAGRNPEASAIVISGFAWQATSDGKIILKPVDTADSNQSFNINSA